MRFAVGLMIPVSGFALEVCSDKFRNPFQGLSYARDKHPSHVQRIDLMLLEYLVGAPIPAGNYWLDEYGNWGYAGIPIIQGNLFASQENSTAGSSESSTFYDPSDGSSMVTGSDGCTYGTTPSGSLSSC